VGEVASGDPGIRLRNAIDLADVAGMRARHVRFVVLHRDPLRETRWPTGVTDAPIDIQPWIERYRALLGPPIFEDDQLVVFALHQE
jgi:hypothetical protein